MEIGTKIDLGTIVEYKKAGVESLVDMVALRQEGIDPNTVERYQKAGVFHIDHMIDLHRERNRQRYIQ